MSRLLVREAADSLAKASTPEPFSRSRSSNWVARVGGLPDYVQHIAHDLVEKRGKSESNAIQMAIGIVKRWCRGGGQVDANTRAAACKAVSEWEAKKAASHAKVQSSDVSKWRMPTLADEMAVRDAALSRLVVFEREIGHDGMLAMLGDRLLEAAAAWNPTMKRTASAPDEIDRHEVYDGGQHVGTVSRKRGMDGAGRDRHAAFSVNGQRVTDYNCASRPDALKALQSHLEEAPARVIALPTAGKFLVANPSSYSGETSYKQFSTEAAARHAAGLPPQPTVPERNSKVEQVAEMLRMDLMTVSGMDIPPLRRVQEARRRDPFDLVLSEAFSADELRGFHGRWIAGGGHHHLRLTPSGLPGRSTRMGRPKPDALRRYDGGVTRESARLRAAHAAKPRVATSADRNPEQRFAAAVGKGVWDRGGAEVGRRLLAQRQMSMAEIERERKAGRAVDTETAHRTGPNGEFSRERQALHEHIISLMLQGSGVHEGRAKAIFTAGGGASGKSAMVASGAVKVPRDAVLANPDIVREMLPEYQALKAAGREDAASLTHEESSLITKRLTRLALGRQHHILVDGVGDSGAGKFAGKIQDALNAGHETSVHYATVPIETALERERVRGMHTGRRVDQDVLREAHASVSARFPELAKLKGAHVQVFDTSGPPRLLAEKTRGSDNVAIKDRSGFQAFLDKAKRK